MIDPERLIRPTGGVRLEPRGMGFPARTGLTTPATKLLLVDPVAIEGVFTDSRPGTVGHFCRYVGLALADFGGPRQGPVWWQEPYLVWRVADHRPGAPDEIPNGWRVLAASLRSESGMLAVIPLHNPMRSVVTAIRQVCAVGRGCTLRLPAGRWSAYYHQYDAPNGNTALARDVVLRHRIVRSRPTPPDGPWRVVLDVGQIRTEDQFFEVVGRLLLLPRRRPEGRFWVSLNEVLSRHSGRATIRMEGWAAFERRLPRLAYRWREGVHQLRTSGEIPTLSVEYDTPPAGPAVPTRRLQVLLARGSDLTLPALGDRLRTGTPTLTVEATARRLDIKAGEWQMHVGYLTDRQKLAEVRAWDFVDQFVELPPEAEVTTVAAAPRVLDVWTTSPSPRSRAHARIWDMVLTTICTGFRKAYTTCEEYESPS